MALDNKQLLKTALKARENSYSPYSGYGVGAALLTEDGAVYEGCNIENAAYSPAICAERTAFSKAVYDGHRKFKAIAIAGGPAGKEPDGYAYPCGVCRQVMMEFCEPDEFRIIVGVNEDDLRIFTLGELLPFGFGPDSLQQQEGVR